ncbi:hypothetical protein DM01DRAFT_1386532 [Hesseltinella vesiculosa]|uniref:Uncharacterized protein n=1 Tax=Hesseltinella vesiculosa TaxID=101127 RepID=A0A1X2G596_9FUNG|nr:hypothetical protein DM01DRAFT_1386532 [Hesseltinella vesiculosa]
MADSCSETGSEKLGSNCENVDATVLAVNSEKPVEAIKGRIIATNRLLKFLKSAQAENKALSQQLSDANSQLEKQKSSADAKIVAAVQDPSHMTKLQQQVDRLTSQFNRIKAEKERLELQVTGHKPLTQCLQKRITQLEKQLQESTSGTSADVAHATRLRQQIKDKDAKMKELQEELRQAQDKYDTLDDDRMEATINLEMVQRDLEDAKEASQQKDVQLRQLQKQLEQAQSAPLRETRSTIAPCPERSSDQDQLVLALKKLSQENEKLKKEKRVLQDRYTEQMVLVDDLREEQKAMLLGRYGVTSSPTVASDDEQTLENDEDVVFEDLYDDMNGTTAIAPRPTSTPMPTLRRPSKLSFSTPSAPSAKKQRRRSTTAANGLVRPKSRVSSPVPQPSTHSAKKPRPKMSVIEKFTKTRLPASMGVAPSAKRKSVASDTGDLDARRRSKRPLLDISEVLAPGQQEESLGDFIDKRLQQVSSSTTCYSDLSGMEPFMDQHFDILFTRLPCIYHGLKSHSSPFGRGSGSIKTRATDESGLEHFGNTKIILLCPASMDEREKAIAWYLWACLTTYSSKNPYVRTVSWMASQIIAYMQQNKLTLACRFTRLLALLCYNSQDIPFLRVFCFDIYRKLAANAPIVYLLLNIAFIAPVTLDVGEQPTKSLGSNMIVQAIQCISAHLCRTSPASTKPKISQVYHDLATLAHWEALEDVPSLPVFVQQIKPLIALDQTKQLYHADKPTFDDLVFNLLKALELAYFHMNDWPSMCKDFIFKDVWVMMQDDVMANPCLELMGLLGRLGAENEQTSKSEELMALRKTFGDVLAIGKCSKDEFPLQITAAQCIIVTSVSQDHVKPVLAWYRQLPSELKPLVPTSISHLCQ